GRGAARRATPGARGLDANLLVIAGQAAIVSADHVAALALGDYFQKFFPDVRENPAGAFLIEPFDFLRPAEKDAAEHQLGHPIGVLLGVSERQRAAPRSAEHLPLVDAEVLAQL